MAVAAQQLAWLVVAVKHQACLVLCDQGALLSTRLLIGWGYWVLLMVWVQHCSAEFRRGTLPHSLSGIWAASDSPGGQLST